MAILPIGFFMPLPLAMMIPFMGTQSAVMMKQAGENWQYGKRLQSAMTNEEFNAQTTLSIFQKNSAEIRSMIPTMKQSIQDMRGFQDFIIIELIKTMTQALETGLGAIFGLTAQQSAAFFDQFTLSLSSLVPTEPPEILPEVPLEDPSLINCPAGQHWDVTTQACVPDDVHTLLDTGAQIFADPANQQYAVAETIWAFGRVKSTTIGGSLGYHCQSNLARGTPPDGQWVVKSQGSSLNAELTKARAAWPKPQYFEFIVNNVFYWALDLR